MNGMRNQNPSEIDKKRVNPEVSVVRCPDYDRDRVFDAVRRSVELLGGMHAFVKPGNRVLIKPNLLKGAPPSAAITTHPEIIRAVIRLVQEAGAEAMVGDSPGFGDLRRVCEKTGVLDVIQDEGAVLTELHEAVKVRNRGRFQHFEIARPVLEADVVINLPKLKTHGMMTLTGAVKNLFGCIPGRRKVQWHFNAGVDRQAFALMLVELCALIKPALTIMDAVLGMEGNGPGSGEPRMIGLVLAGRDPVAVDLVSGSVVGVDPHQLYIPRAAAAAGFGETDPRRIEVKGERIKAVAITGFRIPPQEHPEWRLPEWARRHLKNTLTTRPVIDRKKCVRCGICQGHCPQGVISDSGQNPTINYRNCIRCFCCQEFCPQGAISVGQGVGLRILRLISR